ASCPTTTRGSSALSRRSAKSSWSTVSCCVTAPASKTVPTSCRVTKVPFSRAVSGWRTRCCPLAGKRKRGNCSNGCCRSATTWDCSRKNTIRGWAARSVTSWEVTDLAAQPRIVFFREQSHVVAERQQPFEQFPRFLFPANGQQRVRHPETAREKGTFVTRQLVGTVFDAGAVTQHETVDHELFADRLDSADDPRVVVGQEA